jgi:capsular polysaccharide export protein
MIFTCGLLRGPGFTPQAAWVSARIAGWVASKNDFTDPLAAAKLAHGILTAQIGGAFWARELPDGAERIVLRPASSAAANELVAEALAHYAAPDLLLLADRLPPGIAASFARRGIAVERERVDPWSVLRRARALWVGGDADLAVLGVLAGKTVQCHTPGLATQPDVASALLRADRYGDPRTGQAIDAHAAIDLLCEWREVVKANQRIGCCVGIAFWKRRRMAAFFHNGLCAPRFVRNTRAALGALPEGIAGWNARLPPGLAEQAGTRLRRVEDGFIRSLGLGSGFLPPSSIVVDGRGIYYDPRQPSDLEHILAETVFTAALCQRATALIAHLNQRGVTKYAAGGSAENVAAPPGRLRILVPGQVADDLSVMLGGGVVRSNLALLESVRAANPDAWIVYKPHPDVEAGHRAGVVAVADLQRLTDQVVRGGAISALISQVDAVHTMTSLAGFEALLRGRDVSVLGHPFYAGWGLTHDLNPILRRKRRLSLAELAAGVLLLYPRYLDPVSSLPCGPELLLARLEQPELWRPTGLMRLRELQGRVKKRLQNL